jgi:hypothetical protein
MSRVNGRCGRRQKGCILEAISCPPPNTLGHRGVQCKEKAQHVGPRCQNQGRRLRRAASRGDPRDCGKAQGGPARDPAHREHILELRPRCSAKIALLLRCSAGPSSFMPVPASGVPHDQPAIPSPAAWALMRARTRRPARCKSPPCIFAARPEGLPVSSPICSTSPQSLS